MRGSLGANSREPHIITVKSPFGIAYPHRTAAYLMLKIYIYNICSYISCQGQDLDLGHRGDISGLDKVLELTDLFAQFVNRDLQIFHHAPNLKFVDTV